MGRDEDFTAYASGRWSTLIRSAVFLGCSMEEAQDLAQTTLVRCYTSWRQVERAGDRDAYVYKVLLNCHRDIRRRRWWGERPSSSLPETASADAADSIAQADALHRALEGLSQVNREAVMLRYYAHLSVAQTAEVLGIAPGTVKSRLSRALAQLAADPHLADLAERKSR